ncbi:hypothetical protein [Saccharopolyspora sp. 5N708]
MRAKSAHRAAPGCPLRRCGAGHFAVADRLRDTAVELLEFFG